MTRSQAATARRPPTARDSDSLAVTGPSQSTSGGRSSTESDSRRLRARPLSNSLTSLARSPAPEPSLPPFKLDTGGPGLGASAAHRVRRRVPQAHCTMMALRLRSGPGGTGEPEARRHAGHRDESWRRRRSAPSGSPPGHLFLIPLSQVESEAFRPRPPRSSGRSWASRDTRP
jgi:hypothetical protein